MRLLDRYLLRELLIPFGYCLGGFLIFWISFDLFAELPDLQKDQLRLPDYVEYYLWKLPELLTTVLPVALLLACLYALTNHSRHHELTAIRSAGISLWRLSLPYLLVGLVCSLWLFAVSEVWGPRSADAAERIRKRNLSTTSTSAARVLKNFGFPSGLGRVWQMDTYDVLTGDMQSVHVGWKLPDGARREIVARRGEWRDGVWVFHDAIDTVFSNVPASFPQRTVTNRLEVFELSETPLQIRTALKVNLLFSNLRQAAKRPQLSIREILDYRALYPNEMRRSDPLKTQLHGRLAAPWTCLVVVLVALPFGAPSGRRNAFVGVAASVFLCFAYFICMRMGLTLGTGGRLPAWLAAWGPNLLFGGAGIWLTQRVR
ncbi:MAG: LptF/LptG family permease [Verrucomicrobiales bacterium]|nr:LptF/LptG family permease [Verrucomicrobiales bacterium]